MSRRPIFQEKTIDAIRAFQDCVKKIKSEVIENHPETEKFFETLDNQLNELITKGLNIIGLLYVESLVDRLCSGEICIKKNISEADEVVTACEKFFLSLSESESRFILKHIVTANVGLYFRWIPTLCERLESNFKRAGEFKVLFSIVIKTLGFEKVASPLAALSAANAPKIAGSMDQNLDTNAARTSENGDFKK